MIEVMQKNLAGFTKKEIKKVELSHIVQQQIWHQTCEHLRKIVGQPGLKNFPIKSLDVVNTKTLFGPPVPGVKMKTARKKPQGLIMEWVSLLDNFCQLSKCVSFATGVMVVSGVPNFVIYLRKIKFTTAEYLPRRTAVQLANSL